MFYLVSIKDRAMPLKKLEEKGRRQVLISPPLRVSKQEKREGGPWAKKKKIFIPLR